MVRLAIIIKPVDNESYWGLRFSSLLILLVLASVLENEGNYLINDLYKIS